MLRIVITALLLVATCAVGIYLPHYKALDYFSVLLAVLAGLMVGMAVAEGRRVNIVIELVIAAGFIVLTVLGMWKWTWLVPAGFVLYGLWCMTNYYLFRGNRYQFWFAPLCAAYSILLAGFIYGRYFT